MDKMTFTGIGETAFCNMFNTEVSNRSWPKSVIDFLSKFDYKFAVSDECSVAKIYLVIEGEREERISNWDQVKEFMINTMEKVDEERAKEFVLEDTLGGPFKSMFSPED